MDIQSKQKNAKSNCRRSASISFKGKEIKIILTGDAKQEYTTLTKLAKEEIKSGILKSEKQSLLASIKQKINYLRYNPQYGFHIEKQKIPKEYVNQYEVNNLWKINLYGAWRLIYTIKGNEIEIISLVLDITDHKKYNKKFKYKKR